MVQDTYIHGINISRNIRVAYVSSVLNMKTGLHQIRCGDTINNLKVACDYVRKYHWRTYTTIVAITKIVSTQFARPKCDASWDEIVSQQFYFPEGASMLMLITAIRVVKCVLQVVCDNGWHVVQGQWLLLTTLIAWYQLAIFTLEYYELRSFWQTTISNLQGDNEFPWTHGNANEIFIQIDKSDDFKIPML